MQYAENVSDATLVCACYIYLIGSQMQKGEDCYLCQQLGWYLDNIFRATHMQHEQAFFWAYVLFLLGFYCDGIHSYE